MPEVPAAQVEQESSWKQKAELKTSREYGFGLTQITVTSRFNNFIEAQRVTGLGTDWEHRFDPTFQLTYMVLTDKSNFTLSKKFFDLPKDQIAGMCISYNAGPGRLSFRKAAALTVNKAGAKVDIRKWFGGLDSVHSPAEDRILYDTPLWKAVNQYPDNIINKRAPKYKGLIK